MESDRTVYTRMVVNRLQNEEKVIKATEHFKGVTAIAWTDNDPVVLSKAISKFMKENSDHYTFKTGVVDGKMLDLAQVTEIAQIKLPDLNANDLDAATKIIEGTARSMGLVVTD